ncbi:MAG TPA: ABC transporter permease [Blastocatellia bacterium]|nr:ABC transporter permease [Blastocatellia bacterium]
MRLWRELVYLIGRLRRERAERELDEEIRAHIEMETEQNIADGMSPEQARRAALRAFGNVTLAKEDSRSMWRFNMLETLWQDIKYGFRMLLRNPGFTAVAVVSLALGVGACAAIFSIVDAVLLRSLPYPEPERIMQIREVSAQGSRMPFAEPNYRDLRERNRSLEAVAQYGGGLATVIGGSQPVRTRVLWASGEFFRVLGVEPFAGRAFLPEESQSGDKAVAVVSYGFWQQLLGGRPDFTEATLRIDDRSYTVVGVMPPGFHYPDGTEVWTPCELLPPQTSRSAHNWSVIARLQPGVSFEQARADLSAIGRQLQQEHGKEMDAVDFALIPLQEYMVGNVRQGLLIVLAAVGFLLLVACTNVANLLLAQVTARRKEFAVRAALGASRLRMARQFITENVLLTLTAGALGALLAVWGVKLLIGLNQAALPRADEIGVDIRALAFTTGLALLIAVVLGLVPVIRLSVRDLQPDLKEAGRGNSEHAASKRLRGLLVVAQVAFTLVLLVGAGLLIKSFVQLLAVDPGFRVESSVVMDLSVPPPRDDQALKQLIAAYEGLRAGRSQVPEVVMDRPRQKRLAQFYQQLFERIGQIPGVTAAGGISKLPMAGGGGGGNGTFWIENNPALTGNAEYRQASQGYFAAMGIPLLRGRLFEPGDGPDSPPVAVISQSLAQKMWPDEDPIGKRIQFGNMDGDTRLLRIVGVVGDVRERGLDSGIFPTVYVNSLQRPQRSDFSIVVRAASDPAALVSAMRQAVRELDPEMPTNFRTLEQIFSSALDNRRFSLVIFSVFAAVALVLAAVGVYGVMSYSVTQRTHEIGVRMALGAQAGEVLKLIVGHGLKLVAAGVALGFGAAFALTRLMASLLFGVSATDPVTFAVTSLALIGVALLACYIPGRRATKVDPMIALRYE